MGIKDLWDGVPEFARFNVSGFIGTILFQQMNNFVYYSVQDFESEYKSSVVFGVCYVVSCLWQHALHRHLVFGTNGPYLKSLLGFYASYSISIVLSPIINAILTVYVGLSMEMAYWATLVIGGVVNYFMAAFILGGKVTEEKSA